MKKSQMQLVVSTVAKEHDFFYEDIMHGEGNSYTYESEEATRKFLLRAQELGMDTSSLYSLNEKITKIDEYKEFIHI